MMVKYRVLLLDTKPSTPNHYICLGIYDALKNHPDVELVQKATFGNAIEAAKENQCNLFFAFDGEGLNFEVCRRLQKICGYSILWVTEDPYELHVNLQAIPIFNQIFTNDSGSVKAYGGKAAHLSFAASKLIQYRPVCEDDQCLYDIFFAGTAWPNRVDILRQIANLLDGSIRVKLAMPVNQYLPPIVNFPYPLSSYNWRTSNSEFAHFANRSRITLGLHRDFSATPGSPTKALTPGPRIFEVAMAGGFQLIDQSLAEMNTYFVPNQEIVLFDGQKDCLDKIQYYLAHSQERMDIAHAAQKRALEDHQYKNRIDEIFDLIKADFLTRKQVNLKINKEYRPKILFLSANPTGHHSVGELTAYLKAIREGLKDAYECYVLVPRTSQLAQDYDLYNEHSEVVESFHFDYPYSENRLFCPEREAMYSVLLTRYQINLLHIYHLENHSPGIIFIAKALGIPVVYTWNDDYPMCKNSTFNFNFTPKLESKGYAQITDDFSEYCEDCLNGPEKIAINNQVIRREYFFRALNQVSAILYSSVDQEKRAHQFFRPFAPELIQLVLTMPSLQDSSQATVSQSSLEVISVKQHVDLLVKLYDQLFPATHHQNIEVPFQAFTARECGVYFNSPFWYGGFVSANLPSDDKKRMDLKTQMMRIKQFYEKHGFINGLRRILKGHDGYHGNS